MKPKTKWITILTIAITLSAIASSSLPRANATFTWPTALSPTSGTVNIPVQLNAAGITATSPSTKPATVFWEFAATPGAAVAGTANNNAWNPGEDVIYDSNANNHYDRSPADEPIISGQVVGQNTITPDPGTFLRTDSHIKYLDDTLPAGVWNSGDRVVFDADLSGTFTSGDSLIAGAVIPDIGTTLLTDLLLKFIDGSASCATTSSGSSCSAIWTFTAVGSFSMRAVAVDFAGGGPAVAKTGTISITNPPPISIDPVSVSAVYPGNTMFLSVMLGAAGSAPATDLDAWEATILFDKNVVTPVGVGTIGIPCGPSPACSPADYGASAPFDTYGVVRTPTLDDTIGSVIVGATFFTFPTVGPTGQGTLVQIAFSSDAPGPGTTALHFQDVKLRSQASTQTITMINVVNPGSITDGSLSVTGSLDFSPTTATQGVAQTFTATQTGGTVPVSFSWDFDGDGIIDVGPSTSDTASFTYATQGTFTAFLFVADGAGNSGTVVKSVVVGPPVGNTAPTLTVPVAQTVSEGSLLTFSVSATDPDAGQTITIVCNECVAKGATFTSTPGASPVSGSFSWSPSETQDGDHTFTFVATDNAATPLSDTKTVMVHVNEVNVAPVLNVPGDFFVDEGTPIVPFTVSASDPDFVGGVPQSVTLSVTGIPTGMTCAPALPQTANQVSTICNWSPLENQDATVTLTFTANDGQAEPNSIVIKSLSIGVNEVNQPPTLTVPADFSVTTGQTATVDVSATDPDIVGGVAQSVTLSASGIPTGMTCTLVPVTGVSPSIHCTWLTTPSDNGPHIITFTADDGQGQPNSVGTKQLTITVGNANPVLTIPPDFSINEGGAIAPFTVSASDVDVPAQTVMLSATGVPTGMSCAPSLPASGNPVSITCNWTPSETQDGGTTITFTADDGVGGITTKTLHITVNEVNQAPTLTVPADFAVNELTAIVPFTVSASDADTVGGIPQSVTLLATSIPAGMTCAPVLPLSANSVSTTCNWTPTEAQGPGVFTLSFSADDGVSPAVSKSLVITVDEFNQAPVLTVPVTQSVGAGQLVSFDVTASDADFPANAIHIVCTECAANGATFTSTDGNPATGHFSWTPTAAGGFDFTFTTTDDGSPSLSDTKTVTVNVSADQPPSLTVPGSQTVDELAPLTFDVSASDPDAGQTVSIDGCNECVVLGATFSSTPGNPASGIFSWTPSEAQGPGDYTFTFTAVDDAASPLSDTKTVMVHVNEVNQPPVLIVPGSQTVDEGSLLTFTVSATDADLPPNVITLDCTECVSLGATFNAAAGAFSWTPSEAQGPGDYVFTFKATDNGSPALSDTKTVAVHVSEVNQAPVLTVPGDQSVTVGDTANFDVSATDADLPTNTIAITCDECVANGATFTPTDGNPATGHFSWTTTGVGSFTFTFVATDNGVPSLTDTKHVTIFVGVIANHPPALTVPGGQTVDEGSPLTFSVSATDSDTGQTVTIVCNECASLGATFTSTDGNPTSGSFAWTPSEAQGPGDYTFTFNATDNGSPVKFDVKTVSVHVNEVNLPPVLTVPAAQVVDEQVALAFSVSATDPDIPANILSLECTNCASLGATFDAVTGEFSWTPSEVQGPGDYTATFMVSDGAGGSDTQSVSIHVNEVNRAPVLNVPTSPQTVVVGDTLTFTVTATDPDIPANVVTLSSLCPSCPLTGITFDPATGVFTYVPDQSHAGLSFSIRYVATDNGIPPLEDTKDVNIIVVAANQPPVLGAIADQTIDEGSTLTFTAAATDPDVGQTLTFSLGPAAPAGTSIDPVTGGFTWTPDESQGPNVYTITVIVTDNGSPALSDSQAVMITVNEVNSPPVLSVPPAQTASVGIELSFTVTATDPDIPPNTVTLSVFSGVTNGMAFDPVTGIFTFTPDSSQAGHTFTVTFMAQDNGSPQLSDTKSVDITVQPTNSPPVLGPIGDKTVDEESTLTFTATATDPDEGQTLTFSLGVGAPSGASIDLATGVFTWTPSEEQGPGTFQVTIIVTDNGSPTLSDSETITITVNEVNQPPVLTVPVGQTVDEQSLLSFTVTASDVDTPANGVVLSCDDCSSIGASFDSATGMFSWTPTETQGPGDYTVHFTATDDGTPPMSDTKAVSIHVNEVNAPPVLTVPGPQTATVGVQLSFTVTATDPDIPANVVTLSASHLVSGMNFDPATGSFTFTPSASQAGQTFTVTFTAQDDGSPSLFDTENVDIAVRPAAVTPIMLTFDAFDADNFENGVGELDVLVNGNLVVNIPGGLLHLTGTGVWHPYDETWVSFGPFDITSYILPGPNTILFRNPLTSHSSDIRNIKIVQGNTVLLNNTKGGDVDQDDYVKLTFSNPPLKITSLVVLPASPFESERATFIVSYTGGAGPFRCTFSFGDGTSKTAVSTTQTCSTTKAYNSNGQFTVRVTVRGMTTTDIATSTLNLTVQPQPGFTGIGLTWTEELHQTRVQVFSAAIKNASNIDLLVRIDFMFQTPGGTSTFTSPSFLIGAGQTRSDISFTYNVAAGPGDYCFQATLKYGSDTNGNGVLDDSEIMGTRSPVSGCFELE